MSTILTNMIVRTHLKKYPKLKEKFQIGEQKSNSTKKSKQKNL